MKIAHVNTLPYGGAAVVARRIHGALLDLGVSSLLVTKYRIKGPSENHHYFKNGTVREFLRRELSHPRIYNGLKFIDNLLQLRQIAGKTADGFEMFSRLHHEDMTGKLDILNDADIIHLHWINNFIDYEAFFRHFSQKQFVWTLHDMNPFTGGCHHSDGCMKFQTDCVQCPQIKAIDENYSQKALITKGAALRHLKDDQLIIVSPSRWLCELSKQSQINRRFRHKVIANPTFKIDSFTQSREAVRNNLNLPVGKKIILFASDNLKNPRKGIDLLFEAVRRMPERNDVVLLGVGHRGEKPKDLQVTYSGSIADNTTLSEYFYCSDIFACPSVAENCPLVVIESLTCGTPVVASQVGGIPDLINSENGLLFPVGDVEAIMGAIRRALFETRFDRGKIMDAANKNYEPTTIARQYIDSVYGCLQQPMGSADRTNNCRSAT